MFTYSLSTVSARLIDSTVNPAGQQPDGAPQAFVSRTDICLPRESRAAVRLLANRSIGRCSFSVNVEVTKGDLPEWWREDRSGARVKDFVGGAAHLYVDLIVGVVLHDGTFKVDQRV